MLLQDVLPDMDTGDLLLFHGTSPISLLIDIVTGSKYSHIGMVVRTPGSKGDEGLSIWQSFEPQGGVVFEPLIPFLQKYVHDEPGASYVTRHLNVDRTPHMLAALDAYRPKVLGLPFPDYSQWILNYIAARLNIEQPEINFYCSELVAQTYIEMGLLGPSPLAPAYSPQDFAQDHIGLQLLQGATLGPEIPVATPPSA